MSCFLFCIWTKWKTVDEGDLIRSKDGKVVGKFVIQERECEDCGRREIRTEKAL